MARTIYSATLWQANSGGVSGSVSGPSVTPGFVWDIRDVVAMNSSQQAGTLVPPFSLSVNNGWTIVETPVGTSLTGVAYHWEGRQIITPADVWSASSTGPGWAWRVTGYQLTA